MGGDPGLRAELAVCRQYQVPYSEWQRWTDEDRTYAAAYERWLDEDAAERCSSCGTKESDWIDPESRRPWQFPLWKAQVKVCPGCARIGDAHEQARTQVGEHDEGHLRARLRVNLDSWGGEDPAL